MYNNNNNINNDNNNKKKTNKNKNNKNNKSNTELYMQVKIVDNLHVQKKPRFLSSYHVPRV